MAAERLHPPRPSRLLAGMPHMHEIGTGFTQTILRAERRPRAAHHLTGWRFETQLFYDFRKTLSPATAHHPLRLQQHHATSRAQRQRDARRDVLQLRVRHPAAAALAYCDEGTGTLPAGRWELAGHALLLNSLNAGIGDIDLARSTLRSRGQAWVEGNRFTADIVSGLHVQIGAVPLDRGIPVSFSGTFAANGQSPLTVAADCGLMGNVSAGLQPRGR
jgi:hypothetical protein